MHKDERIDVNVGFEHADLVRRMEILAGRDGAKKTRKAIAILTLIVLAMFAGAIFALLDGEYGTLIALGIPTVAYAFILITYAAHIPKQYKARQQEYEKAKNLDPSQWEKRVHSFSFGHHNLFDRTPAWDEAIPYRSFSRCVEYSDCLYFERDLGNGDTHMVFIPARYLSAQTASEIISRVKAAKARYTCVSELRPADTPMVEKADDDIFDLSKHKLLCEAEYTVTPEEMEKASAAKVCFKAARRRMRSAAWAFLFLTAVFAGFSILIFSLDGAAAEAYLMTGIAVAAEVLLIWAVWYSNITAVSKLQKKLLQDEAKYGSRLALYEDIICVRMHGDDTLFLYNWLPEVFRTPEFICIRNPETFASSKVPVGYFAVPVRALSDADGFVSILEDRMQAASDGAIAVASAYSADEGRPDDSHPLRKAERRGKKILSARYKGVDVCIRRRFRVTELVIDSFVYAEQKEMVENAYELSAVVNGVIFNARQSYDGTVQIFANGFEIASGMHKI